MNADAYLRKQGWKGSGHSLDTTGRGLRKPLLLAHKQDQLGLGKKKAAHTTDDQWWMRAYDQSLQSIGTGKEVRALWPLRRTPKALVNPETRASNRPHRAHSTRSGPKALTVAVCMASL